jgi:hypothetical protein
MATSARRDSVFLVLAPEQSDSYPKESASRSSSMASAEKPVLNTSAVDTTTSEEPLVVVTQKTRRSSSISSDGSTSRRFLRLGPVHFGGDPLESDFVEV